MENKKFMHSKLLKNKKGVEVYGLFMVAMLLVLLITIGVKTISDSSKMDVSLKKIGEIGDIQRSLLESNYNSQKLLFFLDQAVLHASYQSFYDLAQKGGQYDIASQGHQGGCAEYYGYTLWVGLDSCLPTDSNALSAVFEAFLNTELPSYLASQQAFPQSRYSVFLVPGTPLKIIGSNPQPLKLELKVGGGAQFTQQIISSSKGQLQQSLQPLSSETIADEFIASPNFQKTSSGNREIDSIVLHYTAGKTLESAKNTFLDQNTKVSSHYIVDKNGYILQMVSENDIAWHAGCDRSSSNCSISGMNSRSVGIEIVNLGFACETDAECKKDCIMNNNKCWEPYPQKQKDAVVKLAADIITRHPEIRVDDEHILTHTTINSQKSDPGPAFDMGAFIAEVEKNVGQVLPIS